MEKDKLREINTVCVYERDRLELETNTHITDKI